MSPFPVAKLATWLPRCHPPSRRGQAPPIRPFLRLPSALNFRQAAQRCEQRVCSEEPMRQDKLTSKFQLALADAQSMAIGRDHQYIEPLHVMTALLDQQ